MSAAEKMQPELIAGRYQVVRPLGGGGMATVWLAKTKAGTEVALKRMHPKLSSERMRAMFLEEARVASLVSHPNLCACLDVGEHEGEYFLALEYIDGLDLGDVIRRCAGAGRQLPWSTVAYIVREVLLALRALHESSAGSVLHRDISPDNIRISKDGAVKLLDLGVSKAPKRESLTPAYFLKGKIGYSAPEVARGSEASTSSDIYACGVVLWEALTGRRLFHAKELKDAIDAARSAVVPPIELIRPDLPKTLVHIVNRALAGESNDRFASAAEMADALSALLVRAEPAPDPRTLASLLTSVRRAPRPMTALARKRPLPPPPARKRRASRASSGRKPPPLRPARQQPKRHPIPPRVARRATQPIPLVQVLAQS